MELAERMRELMKKEFGIETDTDLIEAVKNQAPLDLGIFVSPYKEVLSNEA